MRAKLSSGQGWDILAIMHKIYREEGVKALWSGTLPSLLLVINPVLQHFVYDQLKRTTLTHRRAAAAKAVVATAGAAVALSSVEAFCYGALGKFVATIVSYPLQVAQSRLRQQSQKQEKETPTQTQTQKNTTMEKEKEDDEEDTIARSAAHYSGTIDCLADLWHRKGLAGLFQGIESKLLQT